MKLDTFGRVTESRAQSLIGNWSEIYCFYYSDSMQRIPSLILYHRPDLGQSDTVSIDTVKRFMPVTKAKYRWTKNLIQFCEYNVDGLIRESIVYHTRF